MANRNYVLALCGVLADAYHHVWRNKEEVGVRGDRPGFNEYQLNLKLVTYNTICVVLTL